MPLLPLLLTRPRLRADAFWAQLPGPLQARLAPIFSPLIDIVPTGTLPDPDLFDAVIFSSAQAIHVLPAAVLAAWRDKPAFVVGPATAQAALDAGFATLQADGDAAALLNLLQQQADGLRLLHIRGQHSRGDIAATATAMGRPTKEVIVYDQKALPLSAEAKSAQSGKSPLIVPLFSPRTATLYATGGSGIAPLYLVTLSPAVDAETSGLSAKARYIAKRPEVDAMVIVLAQAVDAATKLESGATEV